MSGDRRVRPERSLAGAPRAIAGRRPGLSGDEGAPDRAAEADSMDLSYRELEFHLQDSDCNSAAFVRTLAIRRPAEPRSGRRYQSNVKRIRSLDDLGGDPPGLDQLRTVLGIERGIGRSAVTRLSWMRPSTSRDSSSAVGLCAGRNPAQAPDGPTQARATERTSTIITRRAKRRAYDWIKFELSCAGTPGSQYQAMIPRSQMRSVMTPQSSARRRCESRSLASARHGTPSDSLDGLEDGILEQIRLRVLHVRCVRCLS